MMLHISKVRCMITIVLFGCILVVNGCSTKNKEGANQQISNYVEEAISKSKDVQPQYAEIKSKLKATKNLSSEEEKIIDTYITGLFYASFSDYKDEMEDILPTYSKINSEYAVGFIVLPLTVDPNYEGDLINDFDAICSEKTYAWIMKKVDKIELELKGKDETAMNYKKTMYAIAEAKRAIYNRLGDTDNEKRYEELARRYNEAI